MAALVRKKKVVREKLDRLKLAEDRRVTDNRDQVLP